jgi:hypothetical protein
MAKPRVHEIAREHGFTSQQVIDLLRQMGEFVKSASSTIEPPVERQLRDRLGEPLPPDQRRKTPSERALDALRAEPRAVRTREEVRQEILANLRANAPAPLNSFELAARRKLQEQKRGKRFRGQIDAATADSLARMDAHHPPFLDEYERAKRETDEWLTAGWIAPEDIVRWRHACPGIWPEVAVALANAGIGPRLAETRLRHGKIDPDEPTLWSRVQSKEMDSEDARWLLQRTGLMRRDNGRSESNPSQATQ